MKKINNTSILMISILLFLISYSLDKQVNLFFKYVKFPILDVILGIITNFGVVIVAMVVIPSIIFYKKDKRLVHLLWLTFMASFILAFIIKLITLRQRPIDAFTFPFTNIINYSFPSMHAMVIFSLLPLLTKHLPKQNYFWLMFAFLVAFSRVYFGFHFLSDVIFGALFGYFIGKKLASFGSKFFHCINEKTRHI